MATTPDERKKLVTLFRSLAFSNINHASNAADVLESDWLADHDARVRADALKEAASIVRLAPGLMVAADRLDHAVFVSR